MIKPFFVPSSAKQWNMTFFPNFLLEHFFYGIQYLGYGIQYIGYGIQYIGYGIQYLGYGIQYIGCIQSCKRIFQSSGTDGQNESTLTGFFVKVSFYFCAMVWNESKIRSEMKTNDKIIFFQWTRVVRVEQKGFMSCGFMACTFLLPEFVVLHGNPDCPANAYRNAHKYGPKYAMQIISKDKNDHAEPRKATAHFTPEASETGSA